MRKAILAMETQPATSTGKQHPEAEQAKQIQYSLRATSMSKLPTTPQPKARAAASSTEPPSHNSKQHQWPQASKGPKNKEGEI